MKMKSLILIAALSPGAIANSVLAAGTHAGGHGDDAIGVPGTAANVTRTIAVAMTDNMRFTPASITVRQGETIRFKVKNSGKVKHEFVLGTEKELKEHYEVMKKNPEMEHADLNMIALAPGKNGEVIWQFTKPGKVDFACLQPGHYDTGMKGWVTVAARKMPGKEDAAQANLDQRKASSAKAEQAAATGDMTDGEVRKVDKDAKKITIKHGPLTNLDMPAMTMVFQVKDPKVLEQIKAGDRIRFEANLINGQLIVVRIEPAK